MCRKIPITILLVDVREIQIHHYICYKPDFGISPREIVDLTAFSKDLMESSFLILRIDSV